MANRTLNRTQEIIGATSTDGQSMPFPSIVTPPLDAEGRPFSRTPGGQFQPNNTNTTSKQITQEELNKITNNGKNTNVIYQSDINTILGLTKPPSPSLSPSLPVITSAIRSTGESAGDSTTPEMSEVATDETRLVGQQLWTYKAVFFNHAQEPHQIKAHTIKQLVLEDDLLTWPLRGYIIVDAREEGFERSYDDKYYHIRSDARDELYLEIFPIPRPQDGDLTDRIWKIATTCVIYDVEDLPNENATMKMKKLYFWDKNFQHLFEENFQWSTATGTRIWTPDPPEPVAHATEEEKSMLTGEAIASLLIDAGYEDIVDLDNWDKGCTRIEYVTKADHSVWDNIQYLLQFHISEEKEDNCVLEWNRADKKLNFTPYYKIYDKAGKGAPGELQIEHLFFEEKSPNSDTDNVTRTSPFKAPYNEESGTEVDIKIDKYSTITNYRFSQTAGIDNSIAFTTRPVHSHWHKKKQFDIDVKENDIETVKNDKFLTNYVTKLLGNDYPVFVLNLTKKEQKSHHPAFSLYGRGPKIDNESKRKIRSLEGRGKILFAGIFFNQSLIIRVEGSTHRLAGTFIGVDRIRQDSDTDYDWALCGQYFVINVKHMIQQQKYINELTLVKIHAYDALQNNEGVY